MIAQHTPGPWQVSKSLYCDVPKPFGVYRYAPGYQMMRDNRGRERRFETEKAALAAIAKATGGTA